MKNFISKFLISIFQKSLIIFYVLTISCCNTVCGQGYYFRNGGKSKVPDKHKYGFCIRRENGTLKPRKKDVINMIQNAKKDTGMYVTANKKILSYFPIEDSTNANAMQSVQGIFKVVNIEKKNDNYYVKDNHLKKTTLFMYDIEQDCPKQSSLKYIRILVFQHEFGDCLKKMKKGHYYYLTLNPFLQKDCCSPTVINGDTIYRLRQSRGLYTYIIKGVLVPYFSFGDYNIVEISEIEHVNRENSYSHPLNGELPHSDLGGAFMGNALSEEGKSVNTYQFVSRNVFQEVYFSSDIGGALGHEITESYHGGLISIIKGVSAMPAKKNIPNERYKS